MWTDTLCGVSLVNRGVIVIMKVNRIRMSREI
jgi:hypothetical protein